VNQPTQQQIPTCYRHPDQRAGVVCQRCDRPICPHCMIQASVGFHCPECAASGKQRVYTARNIGPTARDAIATYVLIAINVAVFLYGVLRQPSSFMSGSTTLLNDGGLTAGGLLRTSTGIHPIGVDAGQWWRIISSGFLHFGIIHIGFNMFALYVLGPPVERAVGKLGLVTIYTSALLAGSLGGLLVSPNSLGAGASGAIFGLMGALLAGQKAAGINLAEGGLLPIVGLNLLITFAIPNISIGAHLGGLVGGAIAGAAVFYGPRYAKGKVVPNLAGAAVGLVSFVGCLLVAASASNLA